MLKGITGSRSTEFLRRELERQKEKKRIWKVGDFDGNNRNEKVEFHPYGCESDRDPHHHWIEKSDKKTDHRSSIRTQKQQKEKQHHHRRERPQNVARQHEWTRTERHHPKHHTERTYESPI